MRGKGGRTGSSGRYTGITPACAGKRTRPRRWVRPPRDHPRVCGEKFTDGSKEKLDKGSPPRMRGKDRRSRPDGLPGGITPAYAGKRSSVSIAPFRCQDHPRVCGEKQSATINNLRQAGSPPRMRGKVRRLNLQKRCDGITPAHAGKRTRPPWCPHGTRDHPRACGEKLG